MAAYAGKVVIVTGASQGIGRALCLELAAQRPRLVLAARDAQALAIVAAECSSRGAQTLVVPTDVADEASCRALAAAAVERFSGIDVLVNIKGKRGRWLGLAFPELIDRMAAEAVRRGR